MNLGQAKTMAAALCGEEYQPEGGGGVAVAMVAEIPPLVSPDTLKFNSAANSAQIELSGLRRIKAYKKIYQTGVDEEGYSSYNLPYDIKEFRYVEFGDSPFFGFKTEDGKIYFPKRYDGQFTVHYYKNPEEITSATPDSYEFEIDTICQGTIIYFMAAMYILEESKEMYDRFLNLYYSKVRNITEEPDGNYNNEIIDVTGW